MGENGMIKVWPGIGVFMSLNSATSQPFVGSFKWSAAREERVSLSVVFTRTKSSLMNPLETSRCFGEPVAHAARNRKLSRKNFNKIVFNSY